MKLLVFLHKSTYSSYFSNSFGIVMLYLRLNIPMTVVWIFRCGHGCYSEGASHLFVIWRYDIISVQYYLIRNLPFYIVVDKNEKRLLKFLSEALAEREGFEPPVPLSTPVFKTGAFDHSAISP